MKHSPLVGRVSTTWTAVIDSFGRISEVYPHKSMAMSAKAGRGDGADCHVATIKIEITEVLEQPKPKKKGKAA